MTDILEIIGAIEGLSSIIGLSKQAYDKAIAKFGNDEKAKRLALFIALTDLSSSWKKVHRRYHLLFQDLDIIRTFLTAPNGRIRKPQDFAANEFRDLFYRPGAQISSFKIDVQRTLKGIEGRLVDPDKLVDSIESLPGGVSRNLKKTLIDIRNDQEDFFKMNEHVCEYLDKLTPMLRLSDWNGAQIKYIVSEFRNFMSDYQNGILKTDDILIKTIDLFNVVSEY